MPQLPGATFAPDVDIDDSEKWILKLVGFEEQPSKYRDKNKDAMMLIHKWLVYDFETGVAVTDNTTGELFQLWQFTGDATYDNPNTAKVAPAREIANALMGHRLTDEEVSEMIESGWAEALLNRSAQADLEWYADQNGTQKLRVLRLKPYVKPEKRKKAAAGRKLDEDDEE
jgi:hypothetical protein